MRDMTSSSRGRRLTALAEALRERESIAQIRLANAERVLGDTTSATIQYPPDAFRAERDLASHALRQIHRQQGACLHAQDRHYDDELRDGSILLVLDGRSGERYVIECHDDADRSTTGTWYRCDGDTPMTFEEAIGVDEGYAGHEYFRLYTCEQVDDMLDRAGVDDLFV